MGSKVFIILLSFLLTASIIANFLLFKKQNVHLSFDQSLSPVPSQVITPSPTPSLTAPPAPLNKVEIGKIFYIPITDSQGSTIKELKLTLIDYEITDEIIVGGKKANAVEGRKFLVVNLKVENSLDQAVQINTRDYIRLSFNNSGSWVAPDIHNDPVEVQPLSVKLTRLGFPINNDDSDFKLQVGELNGQKEIISLD